MRQVLVAAILALAATPVMAVEIDGTIDAQEWAAARRITDFRLTEPLSRQPATLPSEAWILATDKGLAVAFRNAHPPAVPRNRQRGQRDNTGPVDRVNLYVDFDGDGRTGYNFTVSLAGGISDSTITNENSFSSDWDGNWLHAVSEDEAGWSAELLIPWYIAPMRAADGGVRTLSIGLDRVVAHTGERASWPAIGFSEPRFLSVLEQVEVPAFSQSLLAVTPYVSGVHDTIGPDSGFDAGADVFWKPNGLFQLSATLNPDFGQVESDELVVNFSATETFFSDKRPFFTENQGFFDVPFGSLGQRSRLIYTRRVGGGRDDGDGSGDVAAAVKLNGSAGALNYGVFAATENDEVGRDFYAVRATRDAGRNGFGGMVTRVERPFLDRTANVYEADHRWASERWNVRTTAVASDIAQAGVRSRDIGAQLTIDHAIADNWRQQLYALHAGERLDLRDFGYLERNNFNYVRYELGRRVNDLPAGSVYSGTNWRYAVSRRSNEQGELIGYAAAVNRQGQRRDGGNDFLEFAAWGTGRDDLITRGNGSVRMPEKLFGYYERFVPRRGAWSARGSVRYGAEGLGGVDEGALQVYLEPTFHASDSLTFFAGLQASHNPDWLLWVDRVSPPPGGTPQQLATFRSDQLYLSSGATWLVNDRQQLRVRLEAIGLNARAEQAWQLASDGTPLPSGERVEDFALRNLGFQVRYRYEFAPLSYLYLAYVRGGSLFQRELGDGYDVGGEFREAFALRDSEQLLVKLSYRFEL